jgi:DUF971 family protein
MEIIPVGITANRSSRILLIKWKDGHISEYPYYLLRFACPCVECCGGHDQMSDKPPIDVFDRQPEESQRTKLEELEPVGTYALGFQWADGHSAGIYNWNYLRLLCPCSACKAS